MAKPQTAQHIGATIIAVAVAILIAWAGSDGGARVGALPLFALCAVLAFAINWIAFVPAYVNRTERFYDLTGGITYVTITLIAVALTAHLDARAVLVAVAVIVWAVRLATFLYRRIAQDGGDSRFDTIKGNASQFFMTWTLQALWVTLTAATALAIITGGERAPLGLFASIGFALWGIGFAIEVVADAQKRRFREDPANEGQFIRTGLWAWSRHPNYFGEILLWTGIAIVALPILHGWQWLTLISPIFVTLLLTRISGVPMLERKADKRWGGQPEYEAYKRRTPVLIPKPPSSGSSQPQPTG